MVDLPTEDSYVVGIVHYHASDGSSTQRIWDIPEAVANAIAEELGEPDASSLMSSEHMDGVDVAMSSVPTIFRGDE